MLQFSVAEIYGENAKRFAALAQQQIAVRFCNKVCWRNTK